MATKKKIENNDCEICKEELLATDPGEDEKMKLGREKRKESAGKTTFGFPFSDKNPQAGFHTINNRPSMNTDTLLSLWKKLDSRTKERCFLVYHLQIAQDHFHSYWLSSEQVWIIRRAFLDQEVDTADGERRLRRAIEALYAIVRHDHAGKVERKWFTEIGLLSNMRKYVARGGSGMRSGDPDEDFMNTLETAHLRLHAREFCRSIFLFFKAVYTFWTYSKDCDRALRKLAARTPRYSEEDRRKILDVLEGKRELYSYLVNLINLVDEDEFEMICFGKLKTCGTCGRTNRQKALLTCQRCATEGMYPKERYCDRECQRKDWPEHREIHKIHMEAKEANTNE